MPPLPLHIAKSFQFEELTIKWEPEISLILSLFSIVGLSKIFGFPQYKQDQKITTGKEENLLNPIIFKSLLEGRKE